MILDKCFLSCQKMSRGIFIAKYLFHFLTYLYSGTIHYNKKILHRNLFVFCLHILTEPVFSDIFIIIFNFVLNFLNLNNHRVNVSFHINNSCNNDNNSVTIITNFQFQETVFRDLLKCNLKQTIFLSF